MALHACILSDFLCFGRQYPFLIDQADHLFFNRDDTVDKGFHRFGGHIRGRLDRAFGDAENIENGLDQEAYDLLVNDCDDDNIAVRGRDRIQA